MAATTTIDHNIPLHETYVLLLGRIDLDNSYPTGGYSIDPSGVESIEFLNPCPRAGYVFSWSTSAQKLLVYRQKDPAASGGADIALPEVANGADLSAVTGIRFTAFTIS